ncbi:hypothetical protein SS50377_24920 [Spironucleus salmonicida]|uniref:Uncharacterized protein n=1 Tax=Spironucleus salmonicida TaxID=348837 RepID=V6LIB2_9EUKA|nr:hypothetical protein SS50377_24920 [Spironucleus salmonicida]|eukprot:EST43451.1 Hypothetical protein SS50377_16814 [Spironucleus salmonicida]
MEIENSSPLSVEHYPKLTQESSVSEAFKTQSFTQSSFYEETPLDDPDQCLSSSHKNYYDLDPIEPKVVILIDEEDDIENLTTIDENYDD